jgi:hypothetical protein
MGAGSGPKAQKAPASAMLRARLLREAASACGEGGQGGAGGRGGAGGAGGAGDAPELLTPRKQLPSIAAPRGWRNEGGVTPGSEDEEDPRPASAGSKAARAARAAKAAKAAKVAKATPAKAKAAGRPKSVPYGKHVLGLQSERMELVLVGQKRKRAQEPGAVEAAAGVYERTRALLSFVPPELAEGVARLRAAGRG